MRRASTAKIVVTSTDPGPTEVSLALRKLHRLPPAETSRDLGDGRLLGVPGAPPRSIRLEWPQVAQVGLATGFPVPIERSRALVHTTHELDLVTQQPVLQEWIMQESHMERRPRTGVFRPVFRASPFCAEARRVKAGLAVPTILFLDEGNLCRSVLAEAIMTELLANSPVQLDIRVGSASVGLCSEGAHDERVTAAARLAGLTLPARTAVAFDEVDGIVNTDLVLVMDRFDFFEVFREVAVLDRINPGGFYSSRIKLLGSFQLQGTSRALVDPEINDPLYGDGDETLLQDCIASLRRACAGLLTHLQQLQSRCGPGLRLQEALAQSLQCPLLNDFFSLEGRPKSQVPPVWQEQHANPGSEALWTLRTVNGQRHVVRRCAQRNRVPKGYWTKQHNVERELRDWMRQNTFQEDCMPTQAVLRQSGAVMLATAITTIGTHRIAKAVGLGTQRNRKGYWTNFETLEGEVRSFTARQSREPSSPCCMPSQQELKAAGRMDLVNAIAAWGGLQTVASRMSLSHRRGPTAVKAELRQLLQDRPEHEEAAGCGGVKAMPNRRQLEAWGREDLAAAIQRHGGFKRFAAQLDLPFQPSRHRRSRARQRKGAAAVTCS